MATISHAEAAGQAMSGDERFRLPDRYERAPGRFDKLLECLGITYGQFAFEQTRFDLSPREWFEKQLRAQGWVKKSEVAMPQCERACCQTGQDGK